MGKWLPHWRLLLTSVVVAVLSYFPVGYHQVLLNVPHDSFKKLINISYVHRYGKAGEMLSEGQMASLWSITVSSWQIGSTVGALNAFWLADRFGRKFTLMLIAGSSQLLASVFMILSPPTEFFELLIFGRFLSGFGAGLVCPILHVFLSECSPDRHRGFLNSFAGFVLAAAILAAMALGLPEAWGSWNTASMQLLLGFCLPFNILQIVVYPFFPATPKFLYLTKKKREEAKASVVFYHGSDADVEIVFQELECERVLAGQKLAFCRALRLKSVRLPLIISMMAGIANSSCGVDITDAYSTELFASLGMPDYESKLSSMLFNVAGFVGSTISIFIIDRFRRRTLLHSMLAVCFLCNVSLIFVGAIGRFGSNELPGFGTAAAVLIGVMEVAYGVGPGAILEGLFAEVSPHKVRAAAGSLSQLAYCLTNWAYVFLYPPASVYVGAFAFLIHTVPSCVCLLYFAYYLPETGRKSVADVAGEILAKKGKRATTTVMASVKIDPKKQEVVIEG